MKACGCRRRAVNDEEQDPSHKLEVGSSLFSQYGQSSEGQRENSTRPPVGLGPERKRSLES
jgi:hypothetical protein